MTSFDDLSPTVKVLIITLTILAVLVVLALLNG